MRTSPVATFRRMAGRGRRGFAACLKESFGANGTMVGNQPD